MHGMVPRIIGLCGCKRAGKDTVAEYLVSKNPTQMRHAKISTVLKDTMRNLFNLRPEQLEGAEKEDIDPRYGVSPRKLMQFFGTEIMQIELQKIMPDVGRSFWIRQFLERELPRHAPDQLGQDSNTLVISDLRFMHEYEELRRVDPHALFIRIERSDAQPDGHVSEHAYKAISVENVLRNDGTKEELYAQLDVLVAQFLPDPTYIKGVTQK
jgi:hypothetical protein